MNTTNENLRLQITQLLEKELGIPLTDNLSKEQEIAKRFRDGKHAKKMYCVGFMRDSFQILEYMGWCGAGLKTYFELYFEDDKIYYNKEKLYYKLSKEVLKLIKEYIDDEETWKLPPLPDQLKLIASPQK